MEEQVKLMLGNNLESLKQLEDNSVDSIVTDPPYGLSFMNKKWDHNVPSVEFWQEVYRVLKPGGHVLSFGGTRTYHRLVVNMEDAGFEIRDQIMWLYGSGFPKSHNIGKAVDKLQGNEREVVKEHLQNKNNPENKGWAPDGGLKSKWDITKGQSEWEGFGTGLKPANEPICLARKPLSEKTVALNVLKWGTGGINVDGCRVGSEVVSTHSNGKGNTGDNGIYGKYENIQGGEEREGRFPANIILECTCDEVIKGETIDKRRLMGSAQSGNNEGRYNWNNGDKNDFKSVRGHKDTIETHTDPNCVCYMMDEQSGVSKSNCKSGVVEGKEAGMMYHRHEEEHKNNNYKKKIMVGDYNDKGGASRFFYQAKVSKKERNMGLEGFEEKKYELNRVQESGTLEERYNLKSKNNHPTVKPVQLMTYLCRLITPPNGVVLDPFMGSGSTGISSQLEGFKFIGMEMDEDYFKIAEARINNYEEYRQFLK